MNPVDLIEALQGPDGFAQRDALQNRLLQVQMRLKSRLDRGASADEFSELESALLAVRAGLDTLARLQVTDRVPELGPLVDGPRVIAGEHS